jgi:hypothetical protein
VKYFLVDKKKLLLLQPDLRERKKGLKKRLKKYRCEARRYKNPKGNE